MAWIEPQTLRLGGALRFVGRLDFGWRDREGLSHGLIMALRLIWFQIFESLLSRTDEMESYR